MNDTQLGDSMRSLPRVSASPAFTSDVLRAVRQSKPERHVPFVWRWAAGLAMAACLLAVVHVASLQYMHRQHVAQLRIEQQKLEAELAAVRESATTPEPMVVYENDQGARVLVDFDSAIEPASYKTFD